MVIATWLKLGTTACSLNLPCHCGTNCAATAGIPSTGQPGSPCPLSMSLSTLHNVSVDSHNTYILVVRTVTKKLSSRIAAQAVCRRPVTAESWVRSRSRNLWWTKWCLYRCSPITLASSCEYYTTREQKISNLYWKYGKPLKNKKPNRCHLLYLLYFLDTQHVSGINMSIFRSLRLCCWTTTLAVFFLDCCVLELGCGSAGVVSGLPAAPIPPQPNRTLTTTHSNPRTIQPMW